MREKTDDYIDRVSGSLEEKKETKGVGGSEDRIKREGGEKKVGWIISIFGDSVPGSMIGITRLYTGVWHRMRMVVASRH